MNSAQFFRSCKAARHLAYDPAGQRRRLLTDPNKGDAALYHERAKW